MDLLHNIFTFITFGRLMMGRYGDNNIFYTKAIDNYSWLQITTITFGQFSMM